MKLLTNRTAKASNYPSVFNIIRNSRWTKVVAFLLCVEMLTGNLVGQHMSALTSGPSQPEASSFTPAGVSDLVDPFTGDFSYNIPVMEIGGYPINLAYSSGATMDQEATWVGLGWNLNTGAITRNMRGLPDDFNGDEVVKEYNVKDNETYGINVGLGVELFGFDTEKLGKGAVNFSYGIDVAYNNYNGFTVAQSFNPSIGAGKSGKTSWNVGLGLTSSSSSGFTIAPNVSFTSKNYNKGRHDVRGGLGLGISMNSRTGLGNLSLSGSYSSSGKYKSESLNAKNGGQSESIGSSTLAAANLSFAAPSFTPQIQQPMLNTSKTFNGMVGVAIVGNDVDLKAGGYYSGQKLLTNKTVSNAYGYMYSERGQNNTKAMHDFNREKDGGYTPKTTTKLPITNYTHDVFQLQCQGLSGSIRPFRNDASYIHDQSVVSPSISGSGGFEISTSQIVDGGINASINSVKSESGIWQDDNMAKNNMPFKNRLYNDITEKVHFRLAGEQTVDSDGSFYNAIGKDKAVRFSLDKIKLNKKLVKSDGTPLSFNGSISRSNRQNRVGSVEYLTVREVKALYPHRAKYINTAVAKGHHIAQITVVKPDGTRYIFGLAAYNLTQEEITFSVGQNDPNGPAPSPDLATNTIAYGGTDNSVGNKKGVDNRYDKTTIPAYVHTWYLTEVLSPDYVDVTGDGPSEDDLGNYTLLEYGNYENSTGKYVADIPNYKWRTPVSSTANKAGYNKNLQSDPFDDTANILYGEKQVWYVHKISSKTQVCVFSLSDRNDGYGVTGRDGAVAGTDPLKKIDKISLYAKEDWLRYEQDNSHTPTPVKEAHFNYDYSLCDGVPNNNSGGGKLTLQSVWFTFESSGRARYSPYKFEYSTINPNYDIRAYDRWGYYKPAPTSGPTNSDFPYTTQNKTAQDQNVEAWNLKAIGLPSGGNIRVYYESDDYSYVQDRKASQMFKVIGASDEANGTIGSTLFEGQSRNNYLFFNLENPIPTGDPDPVGKFKKQYLSGEPFQTEGPTKWLYFRFLVNVDAYDGVKEYVSGYAELDFSNCGLRTATGSNYTVGYVKLKDVRVKDDNVSQECNAISKAAWQFSRIQTPRYAFHQDPPGSLDFNSFMTALSNSSLLSTLGEFFTGPNLRMRQQNYGRTFDPASSYIRLLDPDGAKLGGGHRVKKVIIDDNWSTLTGSNETSFTYGQEYEYKNDDGTSSGVAAWEPSMGADENPFRMPVFMNKALVLAPDEQFYIEEPLGEGFYPGASVGYSKVTIKNLQHTNVTTNATGKIVHEFYTAKDFPTKVDFTDLVPYRQKSPIGFTLLVNISFDKIAATQGYCIINNDMHGKPRVQTVYDEKGTQISSTRYEYQQVGNDLDNTVQVVNPDGTVESKTIGVDYDFIADIRQMKTDIRGAGAQINAAAFLAGIIPLIIPSLFPDITVERTMFRSATATKVIYKTGVLKKTTVNDKGAIVSTENVAYDGRTGQVLLTRVNNEYNDERYALSLPAHWAYDRMGFAADNWGFILKVPGGSPTTVWDPATGKFNSSNPLVAKLIPGDEVVAMNFKTKTPINANTSNTANSNRYWVAENLEPDSSLSKYLIKWNGQPFIPDVFNGDMFFKVIRSGRRNMQTAGIGSLELLENPIQGGVIDLDNIKTLNASSQEYSEHWRTKLFRTRDQVYSKRTCGPNAMGTRMIMLMNQLIENDKFVGHYSTPLPPPDVSLTYGGYNLTGLLPSSTTCEYSYTSLASGYTPPWGSVMGLTNNAWMKLVIGVKGRSCPECDDLLLISIDDADHFSTTDFENIANFTSIITIEDYANLSGTNPYLYMVNHPDNLLIIRGEMEDGSIKDFVLRNGCPEVFDIQSLCCPVEEVYKCDLDTINPYLNGVLGNWRPLKSYTYLTDRTPNAISSAVNRRTGGHYSMPTYFWKRPSGGGFWTVEDVLSNTTWRWAWTSEITSFNNAGGEVENVNPLNIYSSAVYGYKQTLPVIVAQNAKYKEIGFDGFEDYYSLTGANVNCVKEHFKVGINDWDLVTGEDAHTGLYSLKYNSADHSPTFVYSTSAPQTRRTTPAVPYALHHNDRLTVFSPDNNGSDKKYIVSFWVKNSGYDNKMQTYNDFTASVKVNGTLVNTPAAPKRSPIIDGWQQLEYEFTIPSGSTSRDIELKFLADDGIYYIDDVRMHPFNATAKSFVYNAKNLRFMAELDENNYATFYEYDTEGALVRVKKETERGVMTLKENRNLTFKRNP
jgi:hypothetical protein